MKTYRIYQTSYLHELLAGILSFIFILAYGWGIFRLSSLLMLNIWETIAFLLFFTAFLAFILWKFIKVVSVVPVELTLDDVSLQHKWIKQYLLYESEDVEIEWAGVKYFEFYDLVRNYTLFELNLINGKSYEILHNNGDKDDFESFREEILKMEEVKSPEEIQKEKHQLRLGAVIRTFLLLITGIASIAWTFYHSPSQWFIYVLGGMLIAFGLMYNIKPVARFLDKL